MAGGTRRRRVPAGTPDRLAPGGLLLYLEESLVRSLLARVDALSAAGSTLLADIIGWTMLWMPPLQPLHDFVRQLGAPWKFGTDEPEELLEPLGWEVTAYDLGTVAAELGRWVWPCSRHPLACRAAFWSRP